VETNIQNRPSPTPTNTVPAIPTAGVIGWFKRHERGILIAAVALQFAVLGAMLVMRLSIVMFGQTIQLRVIPVDPRDFLRGDYVILSYEFSRPQGRILGLASIFPGEHKGRPVYISLEPEGDGTHWRMTQLSVTRPSTGTFIQGKIGEFGNVECGIESYFVQEGKGKAYEDAVRAHRLSAEIAVKPDGQAALKRLHIEE
jgi:uncharacterized membrane-anchored protein